MNKSITWALWLVNLGIIGVSILFANHFLLSDDPNSVAGLPADTKGMPDVLPYPDWDERDMGDYEESALRNPGAPEWRILHDETVFSVNRMEAPPMPPPEPVVEPPPPPVVERPDDAVAQQDLNSKILGYKVIHYPYFVKVMTPSNPAGHLVYPEEDVQYVTRLQQESGHQVGTQSNLTADLRPAGIDGTCLAVLHDGMRVRYQYEGYTYELEHHGDFEMSPELEAWLRDGQAGLSNQPGGSPGTGNAPNQLRPDQREPRERREPVEVDPNTGAATSHYDQQAGVWVIAPEEQEYVRDNMERYIQQTRPRSYYNPETQEYEGIQLQEVPENSLPARRGLSRGDIILSINGTSVSNISEVRTYVRRHPDESSYTVVILRRGQRVTQTYRNPNR